MSGPSRPSASTLQLTLRLTTHPLYPVPTNYHILVERTDTVARLKRQIHSEWEGKPLPEGIVCIKGGRVCRDLEVIGELFPPEASHPDLVLHVIVKPNSWSAPFTSLPPPTPTTSAPPAPVAAPIASPALAPASPSAGYHPAYTVTPPVEPTPPSPETLRNAFTTDLGLGGAIPTPTPATAPNPSPSLGPLVSGFPTYLAYLSQLIPLQRSLLLLNLQKAHYFYSIDVTERMARLGWAESTGSRIDPIVAREEGEEESAFSKREEREKERMRREMEEGNGEVQEVKGLLIECGLWGMVKEKEEEAEVEIRNWGVARPEGNGEFQLVQVGGLPFILQAPRAEPTASTAPPLALYRALKRGQAILHILTTMLQLLITYQPSAPSIAYGRALLRPQGAAPVGGVAAGAARAAAAVAAGPPPAANAAVNRRRATVSIVINLEAMLSLVVPLFLLSLKLGFLLWIFGRHASYTKRLVMGGMAAAWIVWEGWGMYRRRAVVGVMRERVERERERAERQARRVEVAAQAGVQLPAAVARHLPPAPAPAAQAGGGVGELRQRLPAGPPRIGRPPGAPRPRIREPHSRLSPRYWIARIATIGLVEEAHELGLAPRTVAGRPAAPPAPRLRADDRIGLARAARRRVLRTIVVAVVLFFGTLSPEVERKRRRALEKRERLLAERRVWRERIMAERVAAGAAPAGEAGAEVVAARLPIGGGLQLPETRSGASTPGLFEGDHEQPPAFPLPPSPSPQPPASSPSTSLPPPIPSTSTASTSTAPPPIDNQDPTPTTSPAAGRAVVSDAELFADGLGEPEQEPLALPLPGAGAGAGEGEGEGESGTEGEGEGEGETETDEEEERRAGADGEGEGEVDQVLVLL